MKAIFAVALVLALPARSSLAGTGTYWVGVTPWQKGQTGDDINRLYVPLMRYLSENTGEVFKLKPMPSYEGTVEQIAGGEITVAMLSPEPYVHAKNVNPKIELLGTREPSWNHDKTEKRDSYRSHILVRADRRDLTDLASLKGKSFAFVSEESTSGFVVPSAYLRRHKVDPQTYFSKTYLLGSHPAVTDAIAAASVDAGATWDFNWHQAAIKHGEIYKSIWTSDPIPNLCVVAHPKVPKTLREKLRKLLLSVPSQYLEGLSSVGFVYRPDSFYDSIRKLQK